MLSLNTLKFLRESRNLKKKDIYNVASSKYIYNKLEEDFRNGIVNDLLKSLESMNVSIQEFIYLSKSSHHQSNYDFIKDIKTINISSNEDKLQELLLKYQNLDTNIYYLLKSIYYIHHDNLSNAQHFAQLIWNNLESYDDYIPTDIFILTHIFHLFPFDQSEGIINIIEKKLSIYRDFDDFYKTEIIFYLNAGRYLITNNTHKSKKYFTKALNLSIESENGKYAGISYIRLGKLINNKSYIKKGIELLNIFSPSLITLIIDD